MMRLLSFFLLLLLMTCVQAKPVEIVLWYSLAGRLGEEVRQLVADFNRSQHEYIINPVYKGEYTEAITSFAAAFRAKQPPAIVQVFEVGSSTLFYPKGIIKPVDDLMREQGMSLPKDDFWPALRAFYSKDNRLLALPFNTSIPVLFYNADALAKIGYSAHNFPHTWQELEVAANKLKQAGFACAYTSAYPAWIQIESFSALHGLAMLNKQQTRVAYNNEAIIQHLERLKTWQKKHYFEYGGRASDSTVLFTSGRCALFSQSSGSYNSLSELVNFRLGVATLPTDTKVSFERHNNVVGGAALWVTAGQSPAIYRGIARFFAYLLQPDVQLRWHQHTGYLPLGVTGSYALLAQKSSHPILALAQADLSRQQDTQAGVDLGPQNHIRTSNDEALEMIFADIKTAKVAIDESAERAEYLLLRFARNQK